MVQCVHALTMCALTFAKLMPEWRRLLGLELDSADVMNYAGECLSWLYFAHNQQGLEHLSYHPHTYVSV